MWEKNRFNELKGQSVLFEIVCSAMVFLETVWKQDFFCKWYFAKAGETFVAIYLLTL